MSNAESDLGGIIPPLVTPLTSDGAVDVSSIGSLVEFVLDAGVDGVFVLGSSGEAPYLTNDQRREVVATTVAAVAGRVPVLAGALDMTAPRVAEQISLIHEAGAEYAVVAPPNYAIASDDEIVDHYRLLKERSPLSLVAYDIPSRSHRRIGAAVTARLAQEKLICAVKDSSGDVIGMRQTLSQIPDELQFPLFVGSELAVDLGVYIGAAGAVPGLANIDPHAYVRVYEAAQSGRHDEARAEQARLTKLYQLIHAGRAHGLATDASAYGAFKAALFARGVIASPTTARPQTPLPAVVREEVEDLLTAAALLS